MKFKVIVNESMRDYMDISYMIEEARNRKVKPEDLFNNDWDYLVDAKKFFDILTKNADQSYKDKAYRRIALNDSGDEFYDTLLDYLNSEGMRDYKNYPKLEPASIRNGVPQDGRHRAVFCIMLGIPLPVKEV